MNRRVLIVDDEPEIRELLALFCQAEGFICDLVSDGEAASRLMNSLDHKYDLVFLDLKMPGWDGLDTLATYQGHIKNIVILSGYISDEARIHLKEDPRVLNVLQKPFPRKAILDLIALLP